MRKQPMTDDGRPIVRSDAVRKIIDPANVSVWALSFNGKHAGRIVVRYSSALRVYAMVQISEGPLEIKAATMIRLGDDPPKPLHTDHATAFADGGGYDKASAAVDEALRSVRAGNENLALLPDLHGRGMNAVEGCLRGWGYDVRQIL